MEVKEVFYILNSELKNQERDLAIENDRLRTLCFYTIAPYWDKKKNGPLNSPRRLWEIPFIDKHINHKMSKIRRLEPGEKPFTNIINNLKNGRQ